MSTLKHKKILFLSGIDFKEKSIQVIRKTPEAFAERNWNVNYVVLRNISKYGNYFYENKIDPDGITVHRINYRFARLINILPPNILRVIVNKLSGFVGVFQLYFKAKRLIKSEEFDVIYGYEHIGVLALKLLKITNQTRSIKTVSRFQGTWISMYWQKRSYLKLLLNFDFIIAMRFRSDLLIMTDDGTEGDYIISKLHPNHSNFQFWVNGVEKPDVSENVIHEIQNEYEVYGKFVIASISRLESWKKVERGIHIINKTIENNPALADNLIYLIIGDGVEKQNLQQLVQKLKLENQVKFTGAVPHVNVSSYLNLADAFFTFYDLSNVGNPLLEAIRANTIIFTLNNGDTANWVTHKKTGFIYDPSADFTQLASEELNYIISNSDLQQEIKNNVQKLEQQKLWTWTERFNAEVSAVQKLIE